MAKFEYEYNGYVYEIEADNEKSADEKFNQTISQYPTPENIEKTKKQQGQDKKWKEGIDKAQGPWQKTDAYMNAIFGRGNRTLENAIPGLKSMKEKIGPSVVKGVPVAGRYVPQTEELTEFEQNYPKTSKGLQLAGGTAATLPLFGGASKVMGPGFLKQYMGQFGVAAPLNVADTLARKDKNTTATDVSKDLLTAAGTSIVPAAATKLFGQSARQSAPDIGQFMRPGGTTMPSGAQVPPQWLRQPSSEIAPAMAGNISPERWRAGSALVGGALGYGHSMEGAILGALLGPSVYTAAAQPTLRALQHPSTQDILRSLMGQSHSQMQEMVQP